ncbi:cytochrome P450 [Cupriavidus sp. IDO]|uniref:cytochrome P450 n=1 Tax=Cupriavidus sp. IDO TaxID=1539142 RepID=UPI0005799203|nr:cytochrome P450 [Cupriavidus sp. IDO]
MRVNLMSDPAVLAARAQIQSMSLEGINPADPQWFMDDTVGDIFARLRREDPVHRSFSSIEGVGAYWSVTRYRDIMQVETHHEIFSSDWTRGGITLMDFPPGEQQLQMFIAMDPPKHDEERKVVSPIASPGNLGAWESLIRERTCRVLDSLPRNETFDWVDKVSIELTTLMLATLFDFPQEERRLLTHWSDMVTANKLTNPDAPEPEVRMAELRKMLGYFTRLWNERVNAPPRMDLVSMLAHSPTTRNMSPMEYMGNLALLIVGGNDTTRNSMTGGLLALHQHPREMEKLRANPALVDSLVPEIIRWQTPLAYMRRTATQDTELGGKQIRKGDKVAMWYLSANRDDEMISEPDRFIIDRERPRQHLSFGFGIHRCIGSRIAELQLKILWEELLPRFPVIEIVGTPERVRSSFVRGFTHLPVRIPG